MSAPILATKLYIPPPRPKIVLRPRLIERLNEGCAHGCRLTLISAPAGFGKTTLVSEWVASCGRPVAWLSLDERDNDPARFISYLVKALQTIQAGIGEGLLAALQSPQPLQIETILTTLLNEISTIPENFLLVLDDYHSDRFPAGRSIPDLPHRTPAAADAPGHRHPRRSTAAAGPLARPRAVSPSCAPPICALPPPKPLNFSTG